MQRYAVLVMVAVLLVACGGQAPTETPAMVGSEPSGTPSASTPATAAATGIVSAELPEQAKIDDAAPETAEAATPTVAPAQYITVTVEAGDTLLGLALAHGVPMAAIQLQNDLGNSTVVRLGDGLVIPPASAWEGASPYWIVHEVSAGETLSEVAKAYGLTMDAVQGANGLEDVDLLSVGQALVLPLTNLAEARPVVAAPTPPPVVAATATAVAPSGVVAADPTAAPVQIAVVPPPADVAQWPYEVVRIMNEVRAAHGLPPLAYSETLAQAAQIQANDCSARSSCSHTGSDGSTIKDRVLRVGYTPASWAECWAIRPTPQGAIDIWMDEIPPNDPHRRTLLTTWLTEIGIGVAPGPWNSTYFIAVFGRPRQ
jgi:uncharacterized protein YkwD